jgi:hypothetical protein
VAQTEIAALHKRTPKAPVGREEDPPFTIKTMVVKTLWPCADTKPGAKSDLAKAKDKRAKAPK